MDNSMHHKKQKNMIQLLFLFVYSIMLINQGCSLYHDSYDAEGYVVDSRTRIGIEAATVTLSSGEQRNIAATTNTNASGYFKMHLNLGFDSSSAGILIIDKIGYKRHSKSMVGFSSSVEDSFFLEPGN